MKVTRELKEWDLREKKNANLSMFSYDIHLQA